MKNKILLFPVLALAAFASAVVVSPDETVFGSIRGDIVSTFQVAVAPAPVSTAPFPDRYPYVSRSQIDNYKKNTRGGEGMSDIEAAGEVHDFLMGADLSYKLDMEEFWREKEAATTANSAGDTGIGMVGVQPGAIPFVVGVGVGVGVGLGSSIGVGLEDCPSTVPPANTCFDSCMAAKIYEVCVPPPPALGEKEVKMSDAEKRAYCQSACGTQTSGASTSTSTPVSQGGGAGAVCGNPGTTSTPGTTTSSGTTGSATAGSGTTGGGTDGGFPGDGGSTVSGPMTTSGGGTPGSVSTTTRSAARIPLSATIQVDTTRAFGRNVDMSELTADFIRQNKKHELVTFDVTITPFDADDTEFPNPIVQTFKDRRGISESGILGSTSVITNPELNDSNKSFNTVNTAYDRPSYTLPAAARVHGQPYRFTLVVDAATFSPGVLYFEVGRGGSPEDDAVIVSLEIGPQPVEPQAPSAQDEWDEWAQGAEDDWGDWDDDDTETEPREDAYDTDDDDTEVEGGLLSPLIIKPPTTGSIPRGPCDDEFWQLFNVSSGDSIGDQADAAFATGQSTPQDAMNQLFRDYMSRQNVPADQVDEYFDRYGQCLTDQAVKITPGFLERYLYESAYDTPDDETETEISSVATAPAPGAAPVIGDFHSAAFSYTQQSVDHPGQVITNYTIQLNVTDVDSANGRVELIQPGSGNTGWVSSDWGKSFSTAFPLNNWGFRVAMVPGEPDPRLWIKATDAEGHVTMKYFVFTKAALDAGNPISGQIVETPAPAAPVVVPPQDQPVAQANTEKVKAFAEKVEVAEKIYPKEQIAKLATDFSAQGYSATQLMQRAMLAEMYLRLAVLLNYQAYYNLSLDVLRKPSDVATNSPFHRAVLLAVANGLFTLPADGKFRPLDAINRAVYVTTFVRFLQLQQLSVPSKLPFKYVLPQLWFAQYFWTLYVSTGGLIPALDVNPEQEMTTEDAFKSVLDDIEEVIVIAAGEDDTEEAVAVGESAQVAN